MSQQSFFVTGIALAQFIHGARALGLDADGALERAGLRAEEHLLPSARIAEAQYEHVLLDLILASDGESLGVDVGQQLMPPLYGVLMSLAFSAPTLGDALVELSRHAALATGNCGGIEIDDEENAIKLNFVIAHHNPVLRRHIAEFAVTQFSGLIRLISCQSALQPNAVALEHAASSPRAQRRLEACVGCPINWEAGHTQLQVSRQLFEHPILGHADETLQAARQLAAKQLDALQQRSSAIEQIRWHTRELMRHGIPNREAVAERLHLSVRSLDRRLKQADSSWQELLDDLRGQQAREYLADPDLSVAQVAEKLGYADLRAFQRRFKIWTGLTPSAWRKRLSPD